MKLTDIISGSIVRATADIQDNLGTIFPAGTEFRIYDVDSYTNLPGPLMAPVQCDDPTWFYWDSHPLVRALPCKDKLVLVKA